MFAQFCYTIIIFHGSFQRSSKENMNNNFLISIEIQMGQTEQPKWVYTVHCTSSMKKEEFWIHNFFQIPSVKWPNFEKIERKLEIEIKPNRQAVSRIFRIHVEKSVFFVESAPYILFRKKIQFKPFNCRVISYFFFWPNEWEGEGESGLAAS